VREKVDSIIMIAQYCAIITCDGVSWRKSKLKTIITAFIVVLLAGCGSSVEKPKALVARIGADVLARDAIRTHLDFVTMQKAKGIPVDYDAHIPPEVWIGAIKDLTPVCVYYGGIGINIVVALKSDSDLEEGLYIVPYYSSSQPEDKGGFTLSSEPFQGGFPHGSIYTFTRDWKHNKGVERTR
jgi:hypothetical protein